MYCLKTIQNKIVTVGSYIPLKSSGLFSILADKAAGISKENLSVVMRSVDSSKSICWFSPLRGGYNR